VDARQLGATGFEVAPLAFGGNVLIQALDRASA
jgi:hypothetical protein